MPPGRSLMAEGVLWQLSQVRDRSRVEAALDDQRGQVSCLYDPVWMWDLGLHEFGSRG